MGTEILLYFYGLVCLSLSLIHISVDRTGGIRKADQLPVSALNERITCAYGRAAAPLQNR